MSKTNEEMLEILRRISERRAAREAANAEVYASPGQLARVSDLMQRFAKLRGKTNVEVLQALLACKSLQALGFDGNAVTIEQAEGAARVLENWIRKVETRKGQ
jgi:hypothetical protein